MLHRSLSLDSYMNHIYENTFYNDLMRLMNDPIFIDINQKYMKQWSDVEVMILYIKLYDIIRINNPHLDMTEIIIIIDYFMNNSTIRKQIIYLFTEYKKDNSLSIPEMIQKLLKENTIPHLKK